MFFQTNRRETREFRSETDALESKDGFDIDRVLQRRCAFVPFVLAKSVDRTEPTTKRIGGVDGMETRWKKYTSTANQKEIIFYRFSFQVIAVAYTNGQLRLYGVEDAKKIYSYNCSETITCLNWLQEDQKLTAQYELNNFYEDLSATLLPKPINYDILYHLFEKSNNRDFPDNLFIKDTKSLTYLLCTHG